MKRFADRLREARVATGMTQEQLGFELGITKSSVSAWENGRETPSFRMLPELRRVLGRTLDELVCGIVPGDGKQLAEGNPPYARDNSAPMARNEKERALLLRYRNLPAKRRAALLDLLKPSE